MGDDGRDVTEQVIKTFIVCHAFMTGSSGGSV
jgi:hypothetical protein